MSSKNKAANTAQNKAANASLAEKIQAIADFKSKLKIDATNDEIKELAAKIVEAEKEAEFIAYRKQLNANADIIPNIKGKPIKK